MTNLGLTWPPTSGVVPVVTRKLPKAEEVLDAPLPILAIAPGPKPERVGYPCGTYVEVDCVEEDRDFIVIELARGECARRANVRARAPRARAPRQRACARAAPS